MLRALSLQLEKLSCRKREPARCEFNRRTSDGLISPSKIIEHSSLLFVLSIISLAKFWHINFKRNPTMIVTHRLAERFFRVGVYRRKQRNFVRSRSLPVPSITLSFFHYHCFQSEVVFLCFTDRSTGYCVTTIDNDRKSFRRSELETSNYDRPGFDPARGTPFYVIGELILQGTPSTISREKYSYRVYLISRKFT